jgi:hypothetical protein
LPRGRTRRSRAQPGSPGFILADTLAALVIAAIALGTLLAGAGNAVRLVAAQAAKVTTLVQQENNHVQQAPDVVAAGR